MKNEPEKRVVFLQNKALEYELTRKPVKNVNVRICVEGRVHASASSNVPVSFIDELIVRKQAFIIRALEEYSKGINGNLVADKKYVSGENVRLLGRDLRLRVMEGEEEVRTDGIFLYLTVKDKRCKKQKEALMKKWIKGLQEKVFEQICQDMYTVIAKYNITYPRVKVREMSSRWGTCQPMNNCIVLNSRLIEKSKPCIEYVILHEFIHFLYPRHTREFYEFLTIQMPDWRERKSKLEMG